MKTNQLKEIRYFLGIDGGGTKTSFALADINGNIIKEATLGATNPNDVGFEQTFQILTEGINCLCNDIDYNQISVFAGLAGCSSAENMPKISLFLAKFGFGSVKNHNDAQNAIAACLGNTDGIAVIMGTGSIAYAKWDNELYRIGGYGYLFGDLGSGFSIGKDVILSALMQEDGSGEKTSLYPMVLDACGSNSVLSSIDIFYQKGKIEIAKYAPLAFKGYDMGDKVSQNILKNNLFAIANMIKSGKKFSNNSQKIVKVGLIGGLTARDDIIIPELESMLSEDGCKYDIQVCRTKPVFGALYLAGCINLIKN